MRGMPRWGLRFLVLLTPLLAAATPPAGGQEAVDAGSPPLEEPVDLRRADLDDLLALPEMDAATAAALLRCRARKALDLDALFDCARVSPALRAEWREALLWEAERLGPSGAAILSLRGREEADTPGEVDPGDAAKPPPGWLRRELRLRGRAGDCGGALRFRHDADATPAGGADDARASRPTGVVRARLWSGSCLLALGDLAPRDGLGYLVDLAGRGASRGVVPYRAAAASFGGWVPLSEETLDRAAPAGGARRLRGGALLLGGRVLLSAFHYHPGDTGTGVDSLAPRLALPGAFAALRLGALSTPNARASFALVPRLLRLDGRIYSGLLLNAARAGTLLLAEAVLDPAGHLRGGMTLESAPGGDALVQLTAQGAAEAFVNPLGGDSERAPTRGAEPDAGRNSDQTGAGLSLRRRLRPGLWVSGAAAATLEPPTPLRAFRRTRGDLRAGVEASIGSGWTARGELRYETRAAPGPSPGVEAPLRRPGLSLRMSQDGRAGHLRAGWLSRGDLELAGGGAARAGVARIASIVDLRGRCRLSSDLWLGSGVILFDLPAGALQTVYEERPRELSPAVTVRGRGTRAHLAMDVELPFGTAGAFLARERLGGVRNTFWGSVLRVDLGGRSEVRTN